MSKADLWIKFFCKKREQVTDKEILKKASENGVVKGEGFYTIKREFAYLPPDHEAERFLLREAMRVLKDRDEIDKRFLNMAKEEGFVQGDGFYAIPKETDFNNTDEQASLLRTSIRILNKRDITEYIPKTNPNPKRQNVK